MVAESGALSYHDLQGMWIEEFLLTLMNYEKILEERKAKNGDGKG